MIASEKWFGCKQRSDLKSGHTHGKRGKEEKQPKKNNIWWWRCNQAIFLEYKQTHREKMTREINEDYKTKNKQNA